MCVYVVFNAAVCFAFFYLTKVANFNTMRPATKFGKKANTAESDPPKSRRNQKLQSLRTRFQAIAEAQEQPLPE